MSAKTAMRPYRGQDPALVRSLDDIRIVVEQITGVRGGQLLPLSQSASTAEIIEKINEIIARINVT